MFRIERAEFWNAVGAIGQWVGAIATICAVLVALGANKPKIKFVFRIKEPFYSSMSEGCPNDKDLVIEVVNRNMVPVKIIEHGIKIKGSRSSQYCSPEEIHESKEIKTLSSVELWKKYKNDDDQRIFIEVYIIDTYKIVYTEWIYFDLQKVVFVLTGKKLFFKRVKEKILSYYNNLVALIS